MGKVERVNQIIVSSLIHRQKYFLTFPACSWIPMFFSIWILTALIYHIWETSRNKLKTHSVIKNCPVWMNCCSDLRIFANSWPSASNFKSFSRSLEQFFLTVGQNNFGNKIPMYFNIWTNDEKLIIFCPVFKFLLSISN